jgi:hypothetical protein
MDGNGRIVTIVDASTNQALNLPTSSGVTKPPHGKAADGPSRTATKKTQAHRKQARAADDRLNRLNKAIEAAAVARETRVLVNDARPPGHPKPPALTAVSRTAGSGSGGSGPDSEDEDVERAFNVYATPFTPRIYTDINVLPGPVLVAPPFKLINYQACKQLRLGPGLSLLLDHAAAPSMTSSPPPPTLAFLNTESLTFPYYEQFFRFHLEAEIAS